MTLWLGLLLLLLRLLLPRQRRPKQGVNVSLACVTRQLEVTLMQNMSVGFVFLLQLLMQLRGGLTKKL